jgi:hypothetical protein
VEAFLHGANVGKNDLNNTYLNLDQFKKAWLRLANVEEEMTKRGLKPEKTILSASRNKERLLRTLTELETNYSYLLSRVNSMIEKVAAFSSYLLKRNNRISNEDA